MATNTDSRPQMLARVINAQTTLVHDQRCATAIVYPSGDPAYAASAAQLADAIERVAGARPELLADDALLPTRQTLLPAAYRARPLILLGNLGNNRAIRPLYARYYCATDAVYPGGDGYDLRTIPNPYGTGVNFILAGGSSRRGVERAVERLIEQLPTGGRPGELTLPRLLDLELDPALARQLAEWPEAPLTGVIATVAQPNSQRNVSGGQLSSIGIPIPATVNSTFVAIGSYGIMYAWTGDERYGRYAADCLRALNAQVGEGYGDWHYRMERIIYTLPWLCLGGFLSDADVLRADQLILGTTIGTQHEWWRKADGQPPLGQRHQIKGTYAFFQQVVYLVTHGRLNAAAQALCDGWLAECHAYLGAVAEAGTDDEDHDATLNSVATLFWYALGQERYDFFESGSAQRVVERTLIFHDVMGAGAGQSGYLEGVPGSTYLQYDAHTAVAVSLLYYRDGRYQWFMDHMPRLKSPLRPDQWLLSPAFMHAFDIGAAVAAVPDEAFSGLQVVPVVPYHYAISTHPPEHIEYLGHSLPVPETWLRPVGVHPNTLPIERGFFKIAFRSGLEPHGTYLQLHGYQGGWRWQGHMLVANCIVRLTQAGHIFLVQNTDRQSYYFKNGVYISDGYNTQLLPPLAERLASDSFARVALTATRVNDYQHTDWTRHIFWGRAGEGVFVVLDVLGPRVDGPRTFTCTWRTPGYATLDQRTWSAAQGEHTLTLRWDEALTAASEEESRQGATNPYVLRQVKQGEYRAGELVTFQNIFYVRPTATAGELAWVQLSPTTGLVTKAGGERVTWCGVAAEAEALSAPGLRVRAVSAWVSPTEVTLAGMTLLTAAEPTWRLTSTRPVGLFIDLAAARVTFQLDGPDQTVATIDMLVDGTHLTRSVSGGEIVAAELPSAGCQRLAEVIRAGLAALQPAAAGEQAAAPAERAPEHWQLAAQWVNPTQRPERLRNVTVAADPPPLDGFPDQLVDSVLPYMRDARQQWPAAPHYDLTLTFPDTPELSQLQVVGDSLQMPTLRLFQPLPVEISATASDDGFVADAQPLEVAGERDAKRFQLHWGQEERMETVAIAVNRAARQVRVRVPAPAVPKPLVLHEIEAYGARSVSPAIQHMISADLHGDGRLSALVVTAANELIVLDDEAREVWRETLPGIVSHLACHDLDGDGRQSICLGLLGGELHVLSADGALRFATPLGQQCRELSDIFLGFMFAVNGLGIWRREADGRACLMVGAYGLNLFLDAAGQLLGHSWADGSWQTHLITVPNGRDQNSDIWVRNRWCHGITIYTGQADSAASGTSVNFGGVHQPMFRAVRKVIPFVNGDTIAFELLPGSAEYGGLVLTAAETGVGVLHGTEQRWLWTIEHGVPTTACLSAIGAEGRPEVILAGADGFVAAFDALDGRPLRRQRTGAPVVGLAPGPEAGQLVVATRQGVSVLDAAWQTVDSWPMAARKLCRLGNDRMLVAQTDHSLSLLKWN